MGYIKPELEMDPAMTVSLKAVDGSTDLPALMTGLAAQARAAAEVLSLASPEQKNRALDRATSDWVLSLDSDEWITPALRAEIVRAVAEPHARNGYEMPRRSSFCGRAMQHSGWWPDYVLRLFRRAHGRFTHDVIHERLVVAGTVGRLREPIMHEAIIDLDQMVAKMNAYSTSSAQMRLSRGGRAGLATAVLHGAWTFFRTYVLRAGFLDGREGFMLAVANAEGSYYRYLKLMLLREDQLKVTANGDG